MSVSRRIKVTALSGFALVCLISVAVWWQHQIHAAIDQKKVRLRAYLIAEKLQHYVRRTGEFPPSLQAMVADGSLDQHYLSPPQGCTVTYTQPSPAAAGTTTVFVVASAKHQAFVTKDFQKGFTP
jgi:type II secretory pathway pseudopilin PulG